MVFANIEFTSLRQMLKSVLKEVSVFGFWGFFLKLNLIPNTPLYVGKHNSVIFYFFILKR